MSNRFLSCLLAVSLSSGVLVMGQKKLKPYSELPVIQKKEAEANTQVLPLPKEPPPAVAADTGKLVFSTIPLAGKGLLSQQTRDALRGLVRARGSLNVVKLRAFVAGSGDTRRVQEITGEVFSDKHQDIPALSVVQVGALPLEGAQIMLEVTAVDRKVVNPNGLGFFSAQTGSSVADAAAKLQAAFAKADLQPSDAVRVTCFVNSIDAAGDWHAPLAPFSAAAVGLVQMMRDAIGPNAACEGVARLKSPPAQPVTFVDSAPGQSAAALVNTPSLILTGIQMAFGQKQDDVRQGYGRLNRVLNALNSDFSHVVSAGTYLLFSSVSGPAQAERIELAGKESAPASTVLPFEGLASSDATMGVDVVAVPR